MLVWSIYRGEVKLALVHKVEIQLFGGPGIKRGGFFIGVGSYHRAVGEISKTLNSASAYDSVVAVDSFAEFFRGLIVNVYLTKGRYPHFVLIVVNRS